MNVQSVPVDTHDKGPALLAEILIVDDEPSILQSLSKVLSAHYKDIRITTVSSAEQALAILDDSEIRVVVTDLRLPQMDGLELARRIRELSPETVTILMTAFGGDAVLRAANDLGCLAYIEKPFDVDQLLNYIETALNPRSQIKVELMNLSILDVVELYTKKKRDAVLSVMSESSAGLLVIRGGIVSHAQWNTLDGTDALVEILDCQEGTMSSVTCEIPSRQTLKLDWASIERALQFHGNRERVALLKQSTPLRPESPRYGTRSGSSENLLSKFLSQPPDVRAKVIQDIGAADPLKEVGAAPQTDWASDLILEEEAPPVPSVEIRPKKDDRDEKVRKFVDRGINAFRSHKLREARDAWMIALRLDPDCDAAKRNLDVLEGVLRKRDQLI